MNTFHLMLISTTEEDTSNCFSFNDLDNSLTRSSHIISAITGWTTQSCGDSKVFPQWMQNWHGGY